MPRAIWSGAISFGLVNIPVKLFTAVSRKNVQFHQIDARTGARVKMQRVSAADGSEVSFSDIVKGYELAPDHYVLVEPEELDALDPEANHTIDIEEFVDLAEIDPVFYDSAYFVAPAPKAERPYALLVRAMEDQQKVGIARFVMRTKQYLAAVRPKDGHLMLSTMLYADELVSADDLDELGTVGSIEVSDRELGMARQLIESLSTEFEPERHRDGYRDKVLDLIERKAAGEATVTATPAAADEGKVVDLMAALEASVKEARAARSRHPVTSEPPDSTNDVGEGDPADDAEEAPVEATTRAAPRENKSA